MWKQNCGTTSYRTFCVRKRNFKSQNILGVEYLWFLMQRFERHGSAGPQAPGSKPSWWCYYLMAVAHTGILLFSPLLSTSNNQIHWIYVPRLIIVLVIWNINKEKKWSDDYIQTTCISSDHDKNTCKVWKRYWHKTAGGVVHTRCPLSIHFKSIQDWKMTKFKMRKKWQKLIWGLYPNHMHIFLPWQKLL